MDIMIPLQRPDFRILNWTSEEITMYSKEARTLGEALDTDRLHMDLQRIYISNMNRNSEKKQKTDKQQSRTPKNSDHGLEIKSLVVERKDDPESDGYELEKETSADHGLEIKSVVIESKGDQESDGYEFEKETSADHGLEIKSLVVESKGDQESDGYEKEMSADQITSDNYVLKIELPADKIDNDSALESVCHDPPMGSSAILLH